MADYWTAGAAEANGTTAPAAATTDAPMEDEILVSIMLMLSCLLANKILVSTIISASLGEQGLILAYLSIIVLRRFEMVLLALTK